MEVMPRLCPDLDTRMSICQKHETEMRIVNAWKDDASVLHIQWVCPKGCQWQSRNEGDVMRIGWGRKPWRVRQ